MSKIQPLRVLSLDGGGMRGTYTATYLEQVASTFARQRGTGRLDIGAAFDLIVGTSTGGIVACALAAGIPMAEVVELYCQDGPKIFSRKMPSTLFSLFTDLRHRPESLEAGTNALRTALEARLGNMTMSDVYEGRGIALAIPAVEMSQHRSWVFKTAHVPGSNGRDDHYSLVDVCLATSAAPVYRSLAAVDHPKSKGLAYNVFVDGGLWANNPVLVGLIDALDLAAPEQDIQIFSLGTCPIPAGDQIPRTAVNQGLWEWKMGANAAALSIDAQQFAFDHMARKLIGHLSHEKRKCTIVRFPAEKVPGALIPYLGLDDTRDAAFNALINQARTDADMTNSRCMRVEHRDPEAQLICDLFGTMPPISEPLYRRVKPRVPAVPEGASHV